MAETMTIASDVYSYVHACDGGKSNDSCGSVLSSSSIQTTDWQTLILVDSLKFASAAHSAEMLVLLYLT